jgi:long-chain acyl-CoA synthetase
MITENFVEYFDDSIKNHWNLPALSNYQSTTLTYKDVGSNIKWLHTFFEKTGIKSGDKIALLGKNSHNWSVVYLATVTYGAVIVPLLPDFKPDDVHHIVNHSDAVILFAGKSLYETLEFDKFENISSIVCIDDFTLLSAKNEDVEKKISTLLLSPLPKFQDPNEFYLDNIPNDTIAAILYTSGTSGFSKGVILNHNSLAANMRYARANMPLVKSDRILSFLPQAHAYGCAFEFLYPFTLGCHITFLSKIPSPQIIVKAFSEIKPRLILSVPLVIEKIYKKQIKPTIDKSLIQVLINIPGLKNVILKKINKKLSQAFGNNFHEVVIGGAALNKEVEEFLKKIKFRFSIGFGMTECGPLISYASWDTARLFSAGKIVDAMEVKIDSADPYNTVGEILIRGEHVMLGYYKNEEETKITIDEEGWLHTGDLGLIDKDDFIYIKGRSKNMLLGPSGQNIYPEEIEAKINNFYFISESVVVERDEKLVALIFPDSELLEKEKISKEQLELELIHYRNQINKKIPAYMNISKMVIHDQEFDKTPKKSIKRFKYI